MARSPQAKFETALDKLTDAHEAGDVSDAEHDAITELTSAYDPDGWKTAPKGEGEKAYSTLDQYARTLRLAAKRMDTDLTEASADDLNEYLDDQSKNGNGGNGLSENTVKTYSGSLRVFYRFHDALGVDPNDITMKSGGKPKVDERDMFTSDEIQEMRESCTHPRDRALLELFLNTGQRIRAIQTLRVKDIDVKEGRYTLNSEVDGLKKASGRRPLLGAQNHVRDYLRMHPAPDNPDAYLIQPITKSGAADGNPENALSPEAIRRALKKIGERAGVTKPLNPHNFRHSAVTMFKRDYDLDNDTIKRLIGHAPDSNVMETTYSHLSDEDYNKRAEIAAGIRDPDGEDSPLTPDFCDTCSEPLPPNAKACPRCGTVFTPDAASAKEALTELLDQEALQAAWRGDKGRIERARSNKERAQDPEFIELVLKHADDETIQSMIERAGLNAD